jgi:predicted TIM-barrel fold metal-dependent hydrolase
MTSVPNSKTPYISDCHVHVVGPKAIFPLGTARTYTPPDATVEDCAAMLRRIGAERVVLVQPSIYGSDHRCLLHALEVLGERARAVAELPERVSEAEMAAWHQAGIRGLRLNAATAEPPPADVILGHLDRLADHARKRGWHVQLFARMPLVMILADALCRLPVPVVLDHCSLVPCPEAGVPQSWQVLDRLLNSGNVWIKFSGAYRLADDPLSPPVARLFRYLLQANPERLVWGSDWPHTPRHGTAFVAHEDETPYQDVDTGSLLESVCRWAENPCLLRSVLIDNPARLYGFC